ncbi:segregation and condensation protein A [Paeniglutamicibacter cryotolerans]|uniref:Segregation and condensation protein A n=1 Tax=Paeniglutamicibacter cryotolerans TaxID=670079 RepID=A0A839QKB0_9MICC|nr:ScpA family protein [Paeniglutamicibacter cryotolerans]MBB2996287.1 segregation and condensation protein A [Paeniglutamicibacter cryotolerans]
MKAAAPDAGAVAETGTKDHGNGFELSLANFSGPFDLLLGLIAKRELDITEIALAEVTDEFISYIKALRVDSGDRALDEATEFLVVASTLLDLKAARLLPNAAAEEAEDFALLEARDLLFARLLQYKAFKEIAGWLGERFIEEADSFPRQVALEPDFAALLPDLIFNTTAEQLAEMARKVFAPKQVVPTEVALDHLHSAPVSIREQAELLAERLKSGVPVRFSALVADAGSQTVVIARFLALLELYREQVISFHQEAPLGELEVQWRADDPHWNAGTLIEEYEATASDADTGSGPREDPL